MHRSRNSEVLLRPVSPMYRGRDNYSYDYITDRPFELSRRSRSLECGRDFLHDSYYDDYDNRKFERTNMINATLPRRRFEYQPFYVTAPPRETRFYRDEPMRLQAIEAAPTSQHYSPRQIDYEWRYDRSFRDKSGSPIMPSSPQDDYDYRVGSSLYNSGGIHQRSYNTWNRSYYTEPQSTITTGQPTLTSPTLAPGIPSIMNGGGGGGGGVGVGGGGGGGGVGSGGGGGGGAISTNGYYPTAANNTLNKNVGYMKSGYTKSGYLRRENRELRYRMIHCCCFHFRWPPWGIEEAEPPRPMYRHY